MNTNGDRMSEAAQNRYELFEKYSDLQELINEGESENLLLEGKAPHAPKITKDMKANLAKALSGFTNTEGGVIIWGISTTKHEHSGLDVFTQLEPLGNCKNFAQIVEKTIPTLTIPSITISKTKILKQSKEDSKGVVITYVPKIISGPVQSSVDDHFYFRNGDEFSKLPYEMVKRLFTAADIPDLHLRIDYHRIKNDRNVWNIPIYIINKSAAIAEHVFIHFDFVNSESFAFFQNKLEQKIENGIKFGMKIPYVIHKELDMQSGILQVKPEDDVEEMPILKFKYTIYAKKMRAREWNIEISKAKSRFYVKIQKQPEFLF